METYSVNRRNEHRLPQEAPLTMWFLWDSNANPFVCKADVLGRRDNRYTVGPFSTFLLPLVVHFLVPKTGAVILHYC